MNNLLKLNVQYGGKLKVFDINKHKLKFTEDVQNNVKLLSKSFGNKFIIKNNEETMTVTLNKTKLKMSDITFYELKYVHDSSNPRYTDINPLTISFINPNNTGKDNNVYINNIHKTKDISGSNMVKFALALLRKLKIQKAYLGDGAQVRCIFDDEQMQLSKFKMIEKYRTFYMKFGFEPEWDKRTFWMYKAKNKKQFDNKLKKIIDDIRTIKIDDVKNKLKQALDILTSATKNGDYDNFKITHIEVNFIDPEDTYYQLDSYVDIPLLFKMCFDILNILNNTKIKLLYKLLINQFNDFTECQYYNKLMKHLSDNKFYKLEYKSKKVEFAYKKLFSIIDNFSQWSMYFVYDFTKE